MIYAVTGSTGALGSLAIEHLKKQGIPAKDIVAIARNPEKAKSLTAAGVTVRIADYEKPQTLREALHGVDRLLLISSSEVGKRAAQHQAVIDAAKATGVKFVVYTSITRADTSKNPLAPEHKATEAALKSSGLKYALVRNNWYHENYLDDVKGAKQYGQVAFAAGEGLVASATRSDYAEAAVRVLTGNGNEGKIFELGGAAWNFHDLAKAASARWGKPVVYRSLTSSERLEQLKGFGLPEPVAAFVTSLDEGIKAGTLESKATDLTTILGRAPTSLADWVKSLPE